jgi:hypothetical protein
LISVFSFSCKTDVLWVIVLLIFPVCVTQLKEFYEFVHYEFRRVLEHAMPSSFHNIELLRESFKFLND